MPLFQSIDSAREERIGRHGVPAKALDETLARTTEALAWLKARHDDGTLPLLRLPQRKDDLAETADAAARLMAGASDVVFLGKQPAIVDLMSLADVYCLPSADESFGLSALEAMACEVPIVATRVGGVPEVVADNECGYLVPVGDIDQMAERILQLIQDKPLAQRFGRAGRERALTLFPEDKIVSQYESLYQSVIAA